MEFSSPLAAMHHPQQFNSWASRRDLPASSAMYTQAPIFTMSSFNFKERIVKKAGQDYFNLRPHRGSSPTASLAADLSSNCHIDQSPQIPTPRRALFSKDLFLPLGTGHLVTPPIEHEGATTPPIPSSSPGIDIMDISPLPHKAPSFVARVTLPSPSPEPTPDEDEEMLSPRASPSAESATLAIPPPSFVFPTQVPIPERRKPIRPTFSRSKCYSTTSIPLKTNTTAQSVPFQFGSNHGSSLSCSSTSSLPESYQTSQSGSRRPSLGLSSRSSASPISIARKTSTAGPPLKKMARRTVSMYQHPGEVMDEERKEFQSSPSMSPISDADMQYEHKLPHFTPDNDLDGLPRIQQDTLLNVINGDYDSSYDKILIVDCRFEYEYNGGHIAGAINYNDKELLAKELFEREANQRTLLIFHCEYSVHRAPRMAKFVRSRDRSVNDYRYPNLTYPEMYILEGGYSKFFGQHRTLCSPQNYVEMDSKDHEQDCERGMGKLKQRAKLGRAQTMPVYGHAQQSYMMEDSPTGAPRMGARTLGTSFNISPEHAFGIGQTFARRMASY